MTTKAETLTLTFTRDEIHTLLGALNSASIKRQAEAKRCRKDKGRADACNALAEDFGQLFVRIVRAREAADSEAQFRADVDEIDARFQADVDANYRTRP